MGLEQRGWRIGIGRGICEYSCFWQFFLGQGANEWVGVGIERLGNILLFKGNGEREGRVIEVVACCISMGWQR